MRFASLQRLLLQWLLVSFCLAASVLSPKTLVLFDPKSSALQENHSQFLALLEKEELDVTIAEINDENVKLFRNDVRIYQNLIIFPSKVRTIGGGITASKILGFVNDGGDVLAVTSPNGLSESVRGFVNELGIFPSPKNHELIDHWTFATVDEGSHSLLSLSTISTKITDSVEVLYQGSAALLSNTPQLIPILQAPETSYTKDTKSDDVTEKNWTVGKQGYLIVAHQALNNARSVWLGDETFLSDVHFATNEDVITGLVQWVSQSKNVIRVVDVRHSHADGNSYEDRPYKIKDDVVYQIGITEWDGSKYVPYVADDVQVDIKLLDPYHRLTLNATETKGATQVYTAEFKLPDHHGVFSFHTDYRRPGLSFIDEKIVLSIRHLANDEYPRSWEITNSWVYITSSVVVFVAWFFFLLGFIYSKDKSIAEDKKSK